MYRESQGRIFNQMSAGKRGKSSRLETRKHEVIIDFSFESKWLTEWCEFFKTNQSLRRRKTNKISDDFQDSVADPQCS